MQSTSCNSYFIIPSSRLFSSPRRHLLKTKCSFSAFPTGCPTLPHRLGDRKHNSVQNHYLLVPIPDSFSFSEARKRNPDPAEIPGQVIVQFVAAGGGLRLWEANARQGEILRACLTGRGTSSPVSTLSTSPLFSSSFHGAPAFSADLSAGSTLL